MKLDDLQRIKRWQVGHRTTHPVEYHLWDMMLMLWMAGWIGWVPVFALDSLWALPVCLAAMCAPDMYTAWRIRAHRSRRLRCDWLCALGSLARRPDVRR